MACTLKLGTGGVDGCLTLDGGPFCVWGSEIWYVLDEGNGGELRYIVMYNDHLQVFFFLFHNLSSISL